MCFIVILISFKKCCLTASIKRTEYSRLFQTLGSAKRAIQIHRCATDLHLRSVCIQPWSKSGRLPAGAIQMRHCPTCPRPRLFAVRRQRSPASTVSCSPPKSLSRPQRPRSYSRRHSLWLRHVVPPTVAVQPARFQCASRSFNKVFVGRRVAPLPASGKYRRPSSARFAHSSATLAAMASPKHLPSSTACRAKYSAGSSAAALPNPSVKLSANGVPRWPSSAGPLAHFALAAQRAAPSTPAYLKR